MQPKFGFLKIFMRICMHVCEYVYELHKLIYRPIKDLANWLKIVVGITLTWQAAVAATKHYSWSTFT